MNLPISFLTTSHLKPPLAPWWPEIRPQSPSSTDYMIRTKANCMLPQSIIISTLREKRSHRMLLLSMIPISKRTSRTQPPARLISYTKRASIEWNKGDSVNLGRPARCRSRFLFQRLVQRVIATLCGKAIRQWRHENCSPRRASSGPRVVDPDNSLA